MPSSLVSEFAFALSAMIFFVSLLTLVCVRHCLLAIGTLPTTVLSVLIAVTFATGLRVVGAWLICGFVVSHNVCLFIV